MFRTQAILIMIQTFFQTYIPCCWVYDQIDLPISDVTITLFQEGPPEMSVPAAVTPYRMEMSSVRPTKKAYKKLPGTSSNVVKSSAPSGLLVPANLVTCTFRICLASLAQA